jgi:hypothetical protein
MNNRIYYLKRHKFIQNGDKYQLFFIAFESIRDV